VELGGFYTFRRWISVGGVGGFMPASGVTGSASSDGSVEEQRRQLWHVAAQGRLQPFAVEVVVPWAGVEAGFVVMRTLTERRGFASGGNGTSTDSDSALSIGPGVGIDAWVAESIALGLEGWLLYVGFDSAGAGSVSPTGEPHYTSPLWVSVRLGFRLRF